MIGYVIEMTVSLCVDTVRDISGGGSSDLGGALASGATLWLARVAYLPVFGVFLSPAALSWFLAVRGLRSFRLRPG